MAAVRGPARHPAARGRLRQRVPLRGRALPVAAGPGRRGPRDLPGHVQQDGLSGHPRRVPRGAAPALRRSSPTRRRTSIATATRSCSRCSPTSCARATTPPTCARCGANTALRREAMVQALWRALAATSSRAGRLTIVSGRARRAPTLALPDAVDDRAVARRDRARRHCDPAVGLRTARALAGARVVVRGDAGAAIAPLVERLAPVLREALAPLRRQET